MSLAHDWRQAGSTGRAHLVAWLPGPVRARLSTMSSCGVVRFAAWMPEAKASRCGLCRRLAAQAVKRGDPMVIP